MKFLEECGKLTDTGRHKIITDIDCKIIGSQAGNSAPDDSVDNDDSSDTDVSNE